MKLLSYNNDPELKKKFVKEVKWHQDQDKLVQGSYESDGKFCAVGCAIDSLNKINGTHIDTDSHKSYEKYLGLPEWLARLEDKLFEGLPKEDAMKWPLQFASAVPVGIDVEPVKWKLNVYIQKRNLTRVKKLDIDKDIKKQVLDAIQGVIDLNNTAIQLSLWNESAAWSAAESAAWSARSAAWSARSAAESAARSAAESAAGSAARSAAGSAAGSAARSAAESAAWSAAGSAAWSAAGSAAWSAAGSAAESAAGSAAWSAAESAAWSAAESAEYMLISKKLLSLLKSEGENITIEGGKE